MKKIILAIILLIMTNSVFANIIHLECNYDYFRDAKFNSFVKIQEGYNHKLIEEYRKYKWYEFWKKRKIYFMINPETKEFSSSINGLFENKTSADISSEIIVTNPQKLKDGYTDKTSYIVNRITGEFFGVIYSPTTNKSREIPVDDGFMYLINGNCKVNVRPTTSF